MQFKTSDAQLREHSPVNVGLIFQPYNCLLLVVDDLLPKLKGEERCHKLGCGARRHLSEWHGKPATFHPLMRLIRHRSYCSGTTISRRTIESPIEANPYTSPSCHGHWNIYEPVCRPGSFRNQYGFGYLIRSWIVLSIHML